jgi:hypothetical protein
MLHVDLRRRKKCATNHSRHFVASGLTACLSM